MKVPLPPPSGLVLGCPKIPSLISRVGGGQVLPPAPRFSFHSAKLFGIELFCAVTALG